MSSPGFAILVSPAGSSTFHSVNILTGAITAIGNTPPGVTDIAVAVDAA